MTQAEFTRIIKEQMKLKGIKQKDLVDLPEESSEGQGLTTIKIGQCFSGKRILSFEEAFRLAKRVGLKLSTHDV